MLLSMLIAVSCKDDDIGGVPYDPTKPVKLATFTPDSGKFLENVLITGENFGNDPAKIKVYFNTRPAAVIGTTGTRIYVTAPRLPGDTCAISVVVGNGPHTLGKDSLVFDRDFYYTASITVATIVGNGIQTESIFGGSLADTQIQPRYLAMDAEGNLFCNTRSNDDVGSGTTQFIKINEEKDECVKLVDVTGNIPCVAPETQIVSFPTESTVGSFYTADPRDNWAPHWREFKMPLKTEILNDGDIPAVAGGSSTYTYPHSGWKHAMTVNPVDGYIYTRFQMGQVIRINPQNYEVDLLLQTQSGDTYGICFRPGEPNVMYLTGWTDCGVFANSVCSVNVTDPANTWQILSSTTADHRDGPLESARFNGPCQMYSDADDNLYIADFHNHCIRRISPDNIVETVLGIPKTSGFKDGTKAEAMFYRPRGIAISEDGTVYVADLGNARIRKLSIN
jgi:sugar lactone lactonase YvrE